MGEFYYKQTKLPRKGKLVVRWCFGEMKKGAREEWLGMGDTDDDEQSKPRSRVKAPPSSISFEGSREYLNPSNIE